MMVDGLNELASRMCEMIEPSQDGVVGLAHSSSSKSYCHHARILPLPIPDVPLSCSLIANLEAEVWNVAVGLYTALEADRNDPKDRIRNVMSKGRAVPDISWSMSLEFKTG